MHAEKGLDIVCRALKAFSACAWVEYHYMVGFCDKTYCVQASIESRVMGKA